MSNRVGGSGNGKPWVRCSSSHQPAPNPISTLPSLTRSTVTAAFVRTAGSRNVTGETMVPIRIVSVDAASAESIVHASDDPRSWSRCRITDR